MDYMNLPNNPPATKTGPDAYGTDERATWRLALVLTGWADVNPDIDAAPESARGYALGLAHALRAVTNDELGQGEEAPSARFEIKRAISLARDVCASYDAWLRESLPTADACWYDMRTPQERDAASGAGTDPTIHKGD